MLLAPMIIGSLLIVVSLLMLLRLNAQAESTVPSQVSTIEAVPNCKAVTAVPQRECLALAMLYTKTAGAQWLTKTNWLASSSRNAPCDWYGVTCAAGHVIGLNLPRNQLSGTLPFSLTQLTALTRLQLAGNALIGRVPPGLCTLNNLADVDLAYNGLLTRHRTIAACLRTLDPDWQATQTSPVTNLWLTEIATQSVRLTWTPIAYTADGGYYEIAVATDYNGPYTVHGRTANKRTNTYLVDGLTPGVAYFFAVRTYTPPHASQPSALRSTIVLVAGVTKAVSGRVLLAAYFAADNDLSANIGYVVQRMRVGTLLNPNIQVLLLVDGRQEGDTRVLQIAGGQITRTQAVEEQWGTSELNTGDAAVLTWFLRYARTNYPADRTVVTLIGHGLALAPDIEWPPLPESTSQQQTIQAASNQIPPLPREWEHTPSDITNRGYMSAVDVGQALMAATDDGANPFDILFFDQCFQGNLDVLYEVHKTAKVIIASPNYAWLAAAYHRYIARLSPTASPAQMANAIVNWYETSLDRRHPNTIFWIRGSDVPLIGEAVSKLGDALRTATLAGEQAKIDAAMAQSQYVDTTQCGDQNFQLGPPDELIGIESFVKTLRQSFPAGDAYGVNTAIDELKNSVTNINQRSIVGSPYIAPEQHWGYTNTLTILAPLARTSPPDVAWRASLYRSAAPFTATWTLDPSQPVTVTASLAYAREGRWDDFLAVWYQNLQPTVGEWCHYIPPEQVLIDDADAITLTITVTDTNSVYWSWTPSDDTTATEYWLYRQDPYAISWTLHETLPVDQQSFTLTGLLPGSHRFHLIARNADGAAVTESNEVAVEVVDDEPEALYLPMVISE
jgi:hypothetical protein